MTEVAWLDPRGAAARAVVSVPTVLREARRGRLRGFKIAGGRIWRFRPSDVDEWIERSATPVPYEVRRSA